MHRVTIWYDEDGNPVQVAAACLDDRWEVHAEAVEPVGPFHPLDEQTRRAQHRAHDVGGWRAHQVELPI